MTRTMAYSWDSICPLNEYWIHIFVEIMFKGLNRPYNVCNVTLLKVQFIEISYYYHYHYLLIQKFAWT